MLAGLRDHFSEPQSGGGQRHVLDAPAVRHALQASHLAGLVTHQLSESAFAFKATLFDKNETFNWLVSWHQDLSIPVNRKVDLEGWTQWSVKSGVHYVVPPIELMGRILAVRLNLDASTNENGPLRVLPNSHRSPTGSCDDGDTGIPLLGAAGDAWLMRPTLLHASSKARTTLRRRVLHLEFADFDLPGELDWHRRVSVR